MVCLPRKVLARTPALPEVDAAIVLQRGLRRVCTWGSRSYRRGLS